jgi:hypothetical protein
LHQQFLSKRRSSMTWKLSWHMAVIALMVTANIFAIVDTSEAGRRCGRRRRGCGNSCGYSSCNYNYNNCQTTGGCGYGGSLHYGPGEPMPAPPMMDQSVPPQATDGLNAPQSLRSQSGYGGIEQRGIQNPNGRAVGQPNLQTSPAPSNVAPQTLPPAATHGDASDSPGVPPPPMT